MTASSPEPPVAGWAPTRCTVRLDRASDLRVRAIFAAGFALVGALDVWWTVTARHLGAPSQVFLWLLAVGCAVPAVNLARRMAAGFRGEQLIYRFGDGWLSAGRQDTDGQVVADRPVRVDQLATLRVTANLFGRYFVDLADTAGRRLRLPADDLAGATEGWRTLEAGVAASTEAGTLTLGGARGVRIGRFLATRAGH